MFSKDCSGTVIGKQHRLIQLRIPVCRTFSPHPCRQQGSATKRLGQDQLLTETSGGRSVGACSSSATAAAKTILAFTLSSRRLRALHAAACAAPASAARGYPRPRYALVNRRSTWSSSFGKNHSGLMPVSLHQFPAPRKASTVRLNSSGRVFDSECPPPRKTTSFDAGIARASASA